MRLVEARSTFDGLSIALASAVALAEQIRALTFFATHYFELTALPDDPPQLIRSFGRYRNRRPRCVHASHSRRPANRSFGLEVAKLAGVPTGITSRAAETWRARESADGRASTGHRWTGRSFSVYPQSTSPVLDVLSDNDLTKCRQKRRWTRCTR